MKTFKTFIDNSDDQNIEEGYYDRDPFSASKREFKRAELEHELRHEDEAMRRSKSRYSFYRPPEKKEPHAVHINGKKWKTFDTQRHAQNVANKIKGATVHKEEFTNKDIVEEILDVAATYKRIAVQHLKDMMVKNASNSSKIYAKKMHQRALEASKMSNHTDALNHYRGMKEEAEQVDEAVTVDKKNYSWGKMVTVHHGSENSYPLHPEHQEAIKKLKDGEHTTFKDETNRKVTAHREGDKVHLSGAGSNKKTTIAHSHFTEEVEQVDELNKKTLASYVSKAAGSYGRDKQLIGRTSPDGTVKSADPDLKRAVKNRLTGINRAAERLAKEEVEQVVAEMDKSQDPPGRDGGTQFSPGPKTSKKDIKSLTKDPVKHLNNLFAKGYDKKKKGMAEEAEQVVAEGKKRSDRYHIVGKDGKPSSLASYADKASAIKDRDEKHPGAVVQQVSPRGKVKNVVEEIEQIDEISSADSALAKKAEKSGVSLSILKKVYRRGVAAWNSGHRPGTTPQQWGMARVNSYITKGKGTYHGADKDLREEMVVFALEEAIDAIDQGEYDYEGAMSRTQLQTIMRSAKELIDTLRADENMPEWVQSKITKAEDYLSSVRDYMMSRKELGESESWEAGYKRRVVKTTDADHKEKGYNWRIKGKERPEISIKLYKEKPSQAEFNKQMKRVAGHEFGEETVSEDSRLKNDAYHKGLSDSTAKARVAHWKKMDKMSDRDPKSYQPAPGDATAKTKESKHTKKYHAMYGEEVEQIDEISQKLKSSYLEKSRDEVKQLKKHIKGEYSGIVKRMVARRQKGIKLASK